jgi:hypothetical protein
MKDIISDAIKHPLATVILIGSFAGAVAKIIMACKGVRQEPVMSVTVVDKDSK